MKKHLIALVLTLSSAHAMAEEHSYAPALEKLDCGGIITMAARTTNQEDLGALKLDYIDSQCEANLGRSFEAVVLQEKNLLQKLMSDSRPHGEYLIRQQIFVDSRRDKENKALLQLWQKMRALSAEKLQQIREHIEALSEDQH